MQLLSVQVGKVGEYTFEGKMWRSGLYKTAVDGAVWVGRLGLDGDAQADQEHHGGENRAVNVYPAEHYDYWRATPALAGMAGGAFGENFTTFGLVEDTAFIGDVFKVGEVVVQITQPRGPCYKLNRRWGVTDLQQRAEDTHRFGWYLRVLQEGMVQAGQSMELIDRPQPEWSVARVWDVVAAGEKAGLGALLEVAELSEDLKRSIRKKVG